MTDLKDDNHLNRDEKSRANGAAVKTLITSARVIGALEGELLHWPKGSHNYASFCEKEVSKQKSKLTIGVLYQCP